MSPTQFLTRPGGQRLAYDVAGADDAPLVLCTPGLGDTRKVYRFLAPQLVAAGYRVATMDLRGEGESSAGWADYRSVTSGSDLVAMVRHLGGPAVLLSNSYSAAASVVAAADAPDLVTALAMTGPWVRSPVPPAGIKGVFMAAATALVGRFAFAWTSYYRSLYTGSKPADLAAYTKELGASLRQPGHLAALRGMLAGGHNDCAVRLPDVRSPALIVMGTADPDFPDPAAEGEAIVAALRPGLGTLRIVEGAGHYIHAERPDQLAVLVTSFVAEHVNA